MSGHPYVGARRWATQGPPLRERHRVVQDGQNTEAGGRINSYTGVIPEDSMWGTSGHCQEAE